MNKDKIVDIWFQAALAESIVPKKVMNMKKAGLIEQDLELTKEAKFMLVGEVNSLIKHAKSQGEVFDIASYIVGYIMGYNQQWKEIKEKETLK